MELLQRIQPIDFLLVVLWASIVGWGLQTGFIRQIGMLLGVYVAAIAAVSLYKRGGEAVSLAFGPAQQPRWELLSYVVVFVIIFGLVGLIIWRAYPLTRVSRKFGSDNVLGAMVGAVWGVLLLIAIVTMLRFFAVTPWREQEAAQLSVRGQVAASQVAPVLQVVLAPLWQVMAPWFPTAVGTRL